MLDVFVLTLLSLDSNLQLLYTTGAFGYFVSRYNTDTKNKMRTKRTKFTHFIAPSAFYSFFPHVILFVLFFCPRFIPFVHPFVFAFYPNPPLHFAIAKLWFNFIYAFILINVAYNSYIEVFHIKMKRKLVLFRP
jgi:hypothetical protein